jgi:hypothetical protein
MGGATFQNHPSRLAALVAGERTWTGHPCKHHGQSPERSTASGKCLACEREKATRARIREHERCPYLREIAVNRAAAKAKREETAQRLANDPELFAEQEAALLIKTNAEYLRLLMLEKLESVRLEK